MSTELQLMKSPDDSNGSAIELTGNSENSSSANNNDSNNNEQQPLTANQITHNNSEQQATKKSPPPPRSPKVPSSSSGSPPPPRTQQQQQQQPLNQQNNNNNSNNNSNDDYEDDPVAFEEEIDQQLLEKLGKDAFDEETLQEEAKRKAEEAKKKAEEDAKRKVGTFALFQFATPFETFVLILASIGSLVLGAGMPVMSYFMGELLDGMTDDNFMPKIEAVCLACLIIGIATAIGGFLSIGGFMWVAERSARTVRLAYIRAILSQDITWFDEHDVGVVASHITSFTRQYQEGISDKFAIVLQSFATLIAGLVIALVSGWELSLIILCCAPIMAIVGGIFGKLIAKATSGELGKYAQANHISLQSLQEMRTIANYGMEKFMFRKFAHYATIAYNDGCLNTAALASGLSFFFFIIFFLYFVATLYGGYLIRNDKYAWGSTLYTGGKVLAILNSLFSASMSLGQAGTAGSSIAAAQSALFSMLETINRISPINPFQPENQNKLQVDRETFTGGIRFEDVTFSYPTRRETTVLKNFTYTFQPHSAIALVGPSGCGKTSCLSLIERFYDPDQGNILICCDLDKLKLKNTNFNYQDYITNQEDEKLRQVLTNLQNKTPFELHTQFINGKELNQNEILQHYGENGIKPSFMSYQLPKNLVWINLKDVNVGLWRQECIGLVNQSPILFSGNVKENLRYMSPDVTDEQMIEVCKQTGAHQFIIQKLHGYDTEIIEGASNFSGGQRQRLSLARTLLAKPKLALFDEITSMLDSHSERQIQKTLDVLLQSKTFSSISIAHRLSTIKNSDIIIVMKDGKIQETGQHNELYNIQNGIYREMIDIIRGNNNDNDISNNNSIQSDNNNASLSPESNNQIVPVEAAERQQHDIVEEPIVDEPIVDEPIVDEDNKKDGNKTYKKEVPVGYLRRFMSDCRRRAWPWYAGGALFAAGEGAVFPIYSIVLSKVLFGFYMEDKTKMWNYTVDHAMYFLALATAAMLLAFCKTFLTGIAAEKMLLWMRKKTFWNLLYQEIGFHDQEENSPSILSTKLATDAAWVRQVSSGLFVTIVTNIVTVCVSFGISFGKSWSFTLIMMVVLPILATTGFFQFKLMTGFGSKSKEYVERAGLIVIEGLRNIRIVSSFNAEDVLYKKFESRQDEIVSVGTRAAIVAGLGFGITKFALFASYAFSFYTGAQLVLNGHLNFEDMLQVYLSIQMCSFQSSQVISQVATIDKARAAFVDVYRLMDRVSLYDVRRVNDGEEFPITDCKIEFKNVKFHYPTAPTLPVLKDVSFILDPTVTTNTNTNNNNPSHYSNDDNNSSTSSNNTNPPYLLGLIGNSGGGKSTIASQLLPLFYRTIQPGGDEYNTPEYQNRLNDASLNQRDKQPECKHADGTTEGQSDINFTIRTIKNRNDPNGKPIDLILAPRNKEQSGSILIDGNDVDLFNLSYIRKHIVLCSQDPPLFYGTISENIRAGDPSITDEEIVKACKIAHIHHIIEKFPKKYDTLLNGNTSVSGGQRARIALSRAFVRKDVRVIILDESLSALDNISGKKIQQNLVKYMSGKIIISIAHRLDSIRYANKILVLQDGYIAENGTHDELIKIKDGKYRTLLSLQQ